MYFIKYKLQSVWLTELGSWITLQLMHAYHQYDVGSRPALWIAKKDALYSQPQVIKFTSCLPMVVLSGYSGFFHH